MRERLQKIIASSGLMSRRKAEQAILEGRVRVNGVVVRELGTLADLLQDVVECDGVRLQKPERLRTFVFYKPRGVVTTKQDERGRKTVMDFFQDHPSVNPVGRLDFESEGLLLMSQDGQLLLHLTHPRYEFQKIYQISVVPSLTAESKIRLLDGVMLDDGMGCFDHLEELPEIRSGESSYQVTVSEGRNRFVRRMLAAVGSEVRMLKRVQMGPVRLGELRPGERRELQGEEMAAIQAHLEQRRGGDLD